MTRPIFLAATHLLAFLAGLYLAFVLRIMWGEIFRESGTRQPSPDDILGALRRGEISPTPRDTAIDWARAQANQSRMLCGKCGHGMHWRECDPVLHKGGCLCRNDIAEWSATA